MFRTGNRTLDNMLDECRAKFPDRNPLARREALERLWDAWERLKLLADPSDKKKSIDIILYTVTSEPSLRARLEAEAKEIAISMEGVAGHWIKSLWNGSGVTSNTKTCI